ncbi:hypothetical protein OROGR_002421 [Orobanche gracilis]
MGVSFISKKAEKEAAKMEKLHRRQASAATAPTVDNDDDSLTVNYGDVPVCELQSSVMAIGNLNNALKDKEVLIKGRVHTTRLVGKKLAFIVVREGDFTVQCAVIAQSGLFSDKMVKFAAGLSRESIIQVHGLVAVPPNPIDRTSQQVEVQVRKIFCITKSVSTNTDDAARIEKNIEDGFQAQPRFIPFPRLTSTKIAPTMSHSHPNSIVEQQRVIIPNKHGQKLVGLLHNTESKEIVVLCHGAFSSKDMSYEEPCFCIRKEWNKCFPFRLFWECESEGSFAYGNYWREADDLRAVVDHFSGANRVISAVLGHSKGGDVALLYASKYHDIGAVVNVSGRYDLTEGIEARHETGFVEKIKKDGFCDFKKKGGRVYRYTFEGLMDRLSTDMHRASVEIDKDCR